VLIRSGLHLCMAQWQKAWTLPLSDIDLMVIGEDLNYSELYGALQNVESALGRKVSPTFFLRKTGGERRLRKGSFISKIDALPKIFIFGSEKDLQL